MPVSLLIVTHENIGESLLNVVHTTMGAIPLQARAVAVEPDTDPNILTPVLLEVVHEIDQGDGVLVLSDLIGSTPCNIARSLSEAPCVKVISGINLPMLIRVMNYSKLSLPELAEKALSGGKDGVMNCCE